MRVACCPAFSLAGGHGYTWHNRNEAAKFPMNTKAMLHFCLSLYRKPADPAPRGNSKSPLPALAMSLAFCTQVSVAAADNPRVFDIERGNLASALNQFAAQS